MNARYWRVMALDTYGRGDLSICALHLYAGGSRVDAGAAVSASIAPSAGSVGELQSATLGGTVAWSAAAISSSGFAIVWDFGAAAQVDAIRIGARDKDHFPAFITLQCSNDGRDWTTYSTARGVTYPGAGQLSALPTDPLQDANDVLLMDFEGAMADAAGHAFTAYGGAQITAANPLKGASSLALNGSSSYIQTAPHPDFNVGTGPFSLRLWMRPASLAAGQTLISRGSATWGIAREWALQIQSATALVFYYGVRGANEGLTTFTLPAAMVAGGVYEVIMGRDKLGRRRCFVNGMPTTLSYDKLATEYDTTDLSNAANNLPLTIGTFNGFSGYAFGGQLDGIRMRKGEEPPVDETVARTIASTDSFAPLRSRSLGLCIAASSDVGAISTHVIRPCVARDTEFGGHGRFPFRVEGLAGSQKARVTLLRARYKLVARETWSAADGTGEFTGLDMATKFIAVAQDPAGLMHPVGAEHYPDLPGGTP
jgi:hypothetical protein